MLATFLSGVKRNFWLHTVWACSE